MIRKSAAAEPLTGEESAPTHPRRKVALCGAPNVGKSALFNALTGNYVVVSNYPGTTVEISRARTKIGDHPFDVVDTPGMYSLLPVSEEERVTQRIILRDPPDVLLHVVDAKNLERMLPLTLQLREVGGRLVLVINMMDEAEARGLELDVAGLRQSLGIPVVPIVATTGRGVDALREELVRAVESPPPPAARSPWPSVVERCAADVARKLGRTDADAHLALVEAVLLLQGDGDVAAQLQESAPAAVELAADLRAKMIAAGEDPAFELARLHHDRARALVREHVKQQHASSGGLAEKVGALLVNPWTGIPALLMILYVGLYQFVGVFGAGTVVDLIEEGLFATYVNPWITSVMQSAFPSEAGWHYWARELFAGDYGLITLGVSYAVAIVLPIVSLFFLFFSVLEDSGYFPRLALLVDRTFKRIGLNGRAVIPIVLGFACDTMATLVTRVQETKRERLITTFLLALAIPCAAQYGVMAAVLAGATDGGSMTLTWAFVAWAGLIAGLFLISGLVASRLVPGEAPSFYMELPPMRLPSVGNVLVKTLSRMKWYFREILPIFLVASVLIWVGRVTGVFDVLISGLGPVVSALGLPKESAEILLFGFFRRDFGAAGLYSLADTGAMSMAQLLIAAVVLTLFMPCVAQFLVMVKERGLKTALAIAGLVFAIAMVAGLVLRQVLTLVGVMA